MLKFDILIYVIPSSRSDQEILLSVGSNKSYFACRVQIGLRKWYHRLMTVETRRDKLASVEIH